MPEAEDWISKREPPKVTAARTRLAIARHQTHAVLSSLRSELTTQTDWQVWYRARPYPFLAAAFVVGLLLARRR